MMSMAFAAFWVLTLTALLEEMSAWLLFLLLPQSPSLCCSSEVNACKPALSSAVTQRVTMTHFGLASASYMFKQLLPHSDTLRSQLHLRPLWCTQRTLKIWRRHLVSYLGEEDKQRPAFTTILPSARISSILSSREEESYPSLPLVCTHYEGIKFRILATNVQDII